MKLVGITGGIGSGKSGVSEILRTKGFPVYDADSASKRLISSDPQLIQALKTLLGEEIYTHDGSLDRKRMASIIFNNPDLLAQTNAIIHPAVGRDFLSWANKQDSPIAVIESALLLQSKMEITLDLIIVVDAPLETRIRRVIQRDQTTESQVMSRINKQLSSQQMIASADYIIKNDDNDAILPQINDMIQSILNS